MAYNFQNTAAHRHEVDADVGVGEDEVVCDECGQTTLMDLAVERPEFNSMPKQFLCGDCSDA